VRINFTRFFQVYPNQILQTTWKSQFIERLSVSRQFFEKYLKKMVEFLL
jgi:hypothetical protein